MHLNAISVRKLAICRQTYLMSYVQCSFFVTATSKGISNVRPDLFECCNRDNDGPEWNAC